MKTNNNAYVSNLPYVQTKVALPTAQGVRNPQREGSGYAPGGVFVTVTSEAIRLRNHHIWVCDRVQYRRRKAFSVGQAARARQEQPQSRPRSHGSLAQAFDAAVGGRRSL